MNSKKSPNSVKDNFLLRVNADILRILRMARPDLDILSVECSADLSSAKLFVPRITDEKVLSFLKSQIAQNMQIRRVPNLRFIIDDGESNVKRVEELLAQIKSGGTK